MAISTDRFNSLLSNLNEFDRVVINTHIPNPTDRDYKVGYIKRYFVQKANDLNSYIYEIDFKNYSLLLNNKFYKTIELDWKLTGDRNEVAQMNMKSVRFSSTDIKNLKLYLPNYLQFYK